MSSQEFALKGPAFCITTGRGPGGSVRFLILAVYALSSGDAFCSHANLGNAVSAAVQHQTRACEADSIEIDGMRIPFLRDPRTGVRYFVPELDMSEPTSTQVSELENPRKVGGDQRRERFGQISFEVKPTAFSEKAFRLLQKRYADSVNVLASKKMRATMRLADERLEAPVQDGYVVFRTSKSTLDLIDGSDDLAKMLPAKIVPTLPCALPDAAHMNARLPKGAQYAKLLRLTQVDYSPYPPHAIAAWNELRSKYSEISQDRSDEGILARRLLLYRMLRELLLTKEENKGGLTAKDRAALKSANLDAEDFLAQFRDQITQTDIDGGWAETMLWSDRPIKQSILPDLIGSFFNLGGADGARRHPGLRGKLQAIDAMPEVSRSHVTEHRHYQRNGKHLGTDILAEDP